MNPVRANMDDHHGHYRWSSYHCHAIGIPGSIVKDHEVFQRIASTPE
jgi:putative transposase